MKRFGRWRKGDDDDESKKKRRWGRRDKDDKGKKRRWWSRPLAVGQTVKVKKGITEPLLGLSLRGWRGRVVLVDERVGTVHVAWDSITLQKMSAAYIQACEEAGQVWTHYVLPMGVIGKSKPRDREEDVALVQATLQAEHMQKLVSANDWTVRMVLAGVPTDNELAAFNAWRQHLYRALILPFEANVAALDRRLGVREGDDVWVTDLGQADPMFGVLALVRRQQRRFEMPLADLKVANGKSGNAQQLSLYQKWFWLR
ncbi:MAG TPA: calcium-binding protein [Anaerolineae bacterium]|nr:calcium-binding protein [Anaerolineae bacterium]